SRGKERLDQRRHLGLHLRRDLDKRFRLAHSSIGTETTCPRQDQFPNFPAPTRERLRLPLAPWGVNRPSDVVTVTSSCPCARPSVVLYQSLSGPAAGLRVDFVKESSADVDKVHPAALGAVK